MRQIGNAVPVRVARSGRVHKEAARKRTAKRIRTLRDETAYNPLDKQHLGQSVADALLARRSNHFLRRSIYWAGIYAIYYCGGFPDYNGIAERNVRTGSRHLYMLQGGSRRGS